MTAAYKVVVLSLLLNLTDCTALAQSTTSSSATGKIASAILKGIGLKHDALSAAASISSQGPYSSPLFNEKVPSAIHNGSSRILYTNSSTITPPSTFASSSLSNSRSEKLSTASNTGLSQGLYTNSSIPTTPPTSTSNSTSGVLSDTFNNKTTWTGTMPASGSGLAYATACNDEWKTYWSVSDQYEDSVTSVTYNNSGIIPKYTVQLTTLCEGNTQIVGSPSITAYSTTYQPSYAVTGTSPSPAYPSCGILSSDCSILSSSHISLAALCVDASSTSSTGSNLTGSNSVPDCPCTISGDAVQVMYFPVTATSSQDLCAASPTKAIDCPYGTMTSIIGSYTFNDLNRSSVVTSCVTTTPPAANSSRSGPSVVSNGRTFYEDMVYISIQSVWAEDDCGNTVGKGHGDLLISLSTSAVYSMCGGAAYPYRFDDLNGLLPASAWGCQPYCVGLTDEVGSDGFPDIAYPGNPYFYQNGTFYVNGEQINRFGGGYCGPLLYQDWYKPWVAAPAPVRDLDPAWASCGLGLGGWYDPPTALQPATAVAGVSVPTLSASTTPVSQPTTSIAPATPASRTQTSAQSTTANKPSFQSEQASLAASRESTAAETASVIPESSARTLATSMQESSAEGPSDSSNTLTSFSIPELASSTNGPEPTTDTGSAATKSSVDAQATATASSNSANAGGVIASLLGGSTDSFTDPANEAATGPTSEAAANPTSEATADPTSNAVTGQASGNAQGTTAVVEQTIEPGTASIPESTDGVGSVASLLGGLTTANADPVNAASSSSGDLAGTQAIGVPLIVSSTVDQTTNAADPSDLAETTDSADGTNEPSILTIQSQVVTVAQANPSQAQIDGSSLSVGGADVTLSGGQVASAALSGVVIAAEGHTSTLPFVLSATGSDPNVAVVTAGSSVVTASGVQETSGVVAIAGTEISVGGQQITVGSQVISAASSELVISGSDGEASTVILGGSSPDPSIVQPETAATFVVGSQTLTAYRVAQTSGIVSIAGTTLSVGGPGASLNGQVVSEANSGVVVLNSAGATNLVTFSPLLASEVAGPSGEAILTVSSQTLTAYQVAQSSGVVVLAGSSLSVGGRAGTYNGEIVSAASSGIAVHNSAGATNLLTFNSPLASSVTGPEGEAVLTVGSQTITAYQTNGVADVGGTRLIAGGSPINIDGQVISFASNGALVATGASQAEQTIQFSTVSSTSEQQAVIAAGSQVTTISQRSGDGQTEAVVGGSDTLSTGGPAVTIDSDVLTLASSGVLLDGSKTVPWSAATSTRTGSASVEGTKSVSSVSGSPADSRTIGATSTGGTRGGATTTSEAESRGIRWYSGVLVAAFVMCAIL